MKLLFTILLFPFYCFANTYYVSQDGSDDNDGLTTSTPWQTLAKVQENVENGDSVLFAKGSRFTSRFDLSNKNNIYFGVYGSGANPLFWGTGSEIPALFVLDNCTNITFYGLTISDTTISPTDRTIQAKIQTVFQFESSSTNNVIRKCTMDRIGYGAYFKPFSNFNTMDSCDIGNLRMIVNTPQNENDDDDFGGVPVQLSSRNNIVSNNYFHDCYAVSFDYDFDGGGVEFFEEGDSVNGNVVKYNTFYDCNGTFEFGSSSGQLRPHTNNLIMYNKVINSSSLIYINNNPNANYETQVKNLKIYNNIIVQNVASRTGGLTMISMFQSDATAGIVDLKNSIFQLSNGANVARSGQWTGGQLIHTNNIYKLSNGGATNFPLDATEIATSGIIWVNTTDANPLNWDYNIPITSPANGNGTFVGINRDFNNNVVGILEYASIPPVPPVIFNKFVTRKKFVNSLP
jgi:hypothetical protein